MTGFQRARTETMYNLLFLLRGFLDDPALQQVNQKPRSNWIYPDFPRRDARMPRISIKRLPGAKVTEYATGNKTWLFQFLYQIDIWVNIRDIFKFPSDEDGGTYQYQGEKFREYLADEVTGVILEHRTELPRIPRILIKSPSQPLNTELDLDILRECMTIEVTKYHSSVHTFMILKVWNEKHTFTSPTLIYPLDQADVNIVCESLDEITGIKGGVPYTFILGTDYELYSDFQMRWNADPAHHPDNGTVFKVTYKIDRGN